MVDNIKYLECYLMFNLLSNLHVNNLNNEIYINKSSQTIDSIQKSKCLFE